jgi:hypothetical protein
MRRQEGSVLLLVLFICAGVAALIVVTSSTIMIGEQALSAERQGKATLSALAEALGRESARQASEWQSNAPASPESEPVVSLLPSEVTTGWSARRTLRAGAATSEGGFRSLTADVERGRDGLDLPLAAVVAAHLSATDARGDAVSAGVDAADDKVFLLSAGEWPDVLTGLSVQTREEHWALEEGSLARLAPGAPEALAPGVIVLPVQAGERVVLADALPGGGSDQPVTLFSPAGDPFAATGAHLVVALGEGTLDARGLGDLFGVIVSSGGSLELDGTTLHGAAFATEEIALGESGRIVFERPILRWATDRSLVRTRLVPGSRREASSP